MKAPDKIYVHVRTEPRPSIAFSEAPEKNSLNVEYIRKDALLDKLNLALKLRGDGNPDSNDDSIQTIKAMINYIESL